MKMAVSWYIVAFLATGALGASIAPSNEVAERSTCGRVWVTVHSLAVRNLLDPIELNWDFTGCGTRPVQIGLFNGRPGAWGSATATFRINTVTGVVVTGTSLGNGNLPAGWNTGIGPRGPHCLWPWVGAGDTGAVRLTNCLKIQPTWMQDNAGRINRLQIGNLAIPGTHNAGAWRFNVGINNAARDNFVLCQDRSIWQQLVYGIRYFDFRIAFYDAAREEDRYWLNHNFIRVRPLLPLLREIRRFLDGTREVVFLDAHHFPVGFYNSNGAPIQQVHNGLLNMIQRELGPHIAQATQFPTAVGSRGPTLQAFINANRRLVFSYIDNSVVNANRWLWPRLPHLWANTNNPTELFRFLDNNIPRHPLPSSRSPLFSAMAQTTPTAVDIALLRGTLRERANAVNRDVTARLGNRWRANANIISTDFFLGSDVTDVAIALSLERANRL